MKHRVLKEVKEKHYFWLADGISLKSIQELVDVIPMMDEHVFSHHVNDQRHDFHNWVRDIYQDKELATKLLHAKNKETVSSVLKARLAELKQGEKPVKKKKVVKKHVVLESPEPIVKKVVQRVNNKKLQNHNRLGVGIALFLGIGVLSLAALVPEPTGAVVANSVNAEASLLGLGAVLAVTTLLFTTLYVIKRHHGVR